MTVRFEKETTKELKKLNKSIQKRVLSYMAEVEQLDDPRSRGHALVGNLRGYWRYRVDDLRIICKILDNELIICVVAIGHRREIYR